MKFAQITDSHLFSDPNARYRGVDTKTNLENVLDALKAHVAAIDFILFTGDTTQDHEPESYALFNELVQGAQLGLPVYWVPGNHDSVGEMHRHLQPPFEYQSYLEAKGWGICCINTKGSTPAGELSDNARAQLKKQLNSSRAEHLLVVGHHHIKPMASFIDQHILLDAEPLLSILKAEPRVKGYIHGHIHKQTDTEIDGVRQLGCPATSVQFDHGSNELAIASDAPGYAIFTCHEDGGLEREVYFL